MACDEAGPSSGGGHSGGGIKGAWNKFTSWVSDKWQSLTGRTPVNAGIPVERSIVKYGEISQGYAPSESGLPPKLQSDITKNLKPGEKLAVRGLPDGAIELGQQYGFKPVKAQTIQIRADGLRITNQGPFAADLDAQWMIDGNGDMVLGQNFYNPDVHNPGISNMINKSFGLAVFQHGHHWEEINIGEGYIVVDTSAGYKNYLQSQVWVFGSNGCLGSGPALDMYRALLP